MYKSIKVRVYPNKDQIEVLTQHFGAARFVYNYFLNQINENYKLDKTSKVPSAFDINKKLTILKKEDDYSWLKDIHAQAMQQVAGNLSTAFKRFFGKVSKYPAFKSKYNGHQSVSFPQGNSITGNKIKVPKLGLIKGKFSSVIEDEAKIKSCTNRTSPTGKYYASVLLEYNKELPVPTTIEQDKSIGIDLGISHFAILSNGKKFDNPKYFKNTQIKLAKYQKMFARCKKSSLNRANRKLQVAKIHEKIVNKRNDFQHKLTHELVYKSHDTTFVLETLSVKNMVKNRKLSKTISDCSWSSFVDKLKYKCAFVGKNVIQIDRFFPSSKTCSHCGEAIAKLPLTIREWTCSCCDTVHDRDVNAATNILKFGLQIPY